MFVNESVKERILSGDTNNAGMVISLQLMLVSTLPHTHMTVLLHYIQHILINLGSVGSEDEPL